ncbi:MAG: hypothetical protein ABJB97_06510 [Acidobacteriota bacterium]
MNANVVLSVRKGPEKTSRFRPQLVAYFRNLIQKKVKADPSLPVFLGASDAGSTKYFVALHKALPSAFRSSNSAFGDVFDGTIAYSIQFFRSATCDSLSRRRVDADLELAFDELRLEDDSSAEWEYVLDDDYLALSRTLRLWVLKETSSFTSIEDFPGSTAVVWLGPSDQDLTVDYIRINLRGASFETSRFTKIIGAGGGQLDTPENAAKLRGIRFQGYCYSIPAR